MMQDDEITSSQELALLQESLPEIFPEAGTYSTDDGGLLSATEIFNSEEEPSAAQQNGIIINGQNQYLDVQSSSQLYTPYVNQSTIQIQPTEATTANFIPYPVPSIMSPICVPPKNSWTGDYGFDVHFGVANKTTKGATWIYSTTKDKLYVMRNSPCPISIVVRRSVPNGCIIRVMAVFSQPTHSQDLARRCFNHASKDIHAGMQHPYQLIRCECDLAYYESPESGQMSVSVPYERPPIGESCSTYIFKFLCFGSCSGGPNRRPLMMIFTLEKGGMTLGRRSLDLKICACPTRDFNKDETQKADNKKTNVPPSKKRKIEQETYPEYFSNLLQFIDKMKDCGKKPEPMPNKDGPFTITANDYAEYMFLISVKFLYELRENMSQLSPSIVDYLKSAKKAKKNGDSTDGSD